MTKILVLASETIGGAALLDAVRRKAESGDAEFYVVVPQSRPRHGMVIYDDAVRDAAQVRVDLTQAFMEAEGLKGTGEVGDPDPFTAAMDAIGAYGIDEVIVSTRPAATSGWLRRDLPERIGQEAGVPVEHVVVDIDSEGLPFDVTLVVANQTLATEELVAYLTQKANESPRRFIICAPVDSGNGPDVRAGRERLRHLIASLRERDIVAAGFIGDPDPFTAVMNALQTFLISEVVISTLPETASKWIQKGLVERVRRASGRPVEHVASESAVSPA
jgi:hypothetical protein